MQLCEKHVSLIFSHLKQFTKNKCMTSATVFPHFQERRTGQLCTPSCQNGLQSFKNKCSRQWKDSEFKGDKQGAQAQSQHRKGNWECGHGALWAGRLAGAPIFHMYSFLAPLLILISPGTHGHSSRTCVLHLQGRPS